VILVTLAAWVAGVLVTAALGLNTPFIVSISAVVLCLLPALATLVLAEKARSWPPHVQIAVLLGGTGIRMIAVAVAAVVLARSVAALDVETGFMRWVVGFYFVTLAAEAYVVARSYSVPRAKS